jgi:hypothetical protein
MNNVCLGTLNLNPPQHFNGCSLCFFLVLSPMEKLRVLVNDIAYARDQKKLSTLQRSLTPVLSFASSLYRVALSFRHCLYHFALLRKHR